MPENRTSLAVDDLLAEDWKLEGNTLIPVKSLVAIAEKFKRMDEALKVADSLWTTGLTPNEDAKLLIREALAFDPLA